MPHDLNKLPDRHSRMSWGELSYVNTDLYLFFLCFCLTLISLTSSTVPPQGSDADSTTHPPYQQPLPSARLTDTHGYGLFPQPALHDDHDAHALSYPDTPILHSPGKESVDMLLRNRYRQIWIAYTQKDIFRVPTVTKKTLKTLFMH